MIAMGSFYPNLLMSGKFMKWMFHWIVTWNFTIAEFMSLNAGSITIRKNEAQFKICTNLVSIP